MRFDVVYRGDSCEIEPHFCREWDENGGCHGTNEDHGLSFDEACDEVADFYLQLSLQWREREHFICESYKKGV